ncbi:MAG: diguanylate cyclase [Gemmatimonadota bacterium]
MDNGLPAIIDRLKVLLGAEIMSDDRWKMFLDEIGTYNDQICNEERSLLTNNKALLAIINLIPVAFFVKDRKSRFFLMNSACEEQWGMSFNDLHNTDGSQFFPPAQMEHFLATDRSIFANRKPVDFEETFWSAARQSDRIGHTFKRPMYDANGDPQYLVCVTLDITDQKLAQTALADSEKKLQVLADTDPLTNLPNRRQFFARLSDEFARFQRFAGMRSSVVMLDLDHFKRINDTYGHTSGDAVLMHFARLMRSTIREIDTPARMGGEEFAILLPSTDSAGARTIAERLREAVATTPLVHDGKTLSVTVSIGIATIDRRDSSGDEAGQRGDEALYRAKNNGRNRVELAVSEIPGTK